MEQSTISVQRQSRISVERITATDESQAREIIYRYVDKHFSLTDALSFVVMERVGVSAAFTFDHDFARYGLESVP
jgi:predicted nucleic acid-binding protein